ncbi:MAG: alpha/beta hydrolase [Candidatus Hydrogenedentes bacterium]|nr:alpha/beta hydrolase [Candidatus Hydrogenedentota bacterium]
MKRNWCILALLLVPVAWAQEVPYDQVQDHVYATIDGQDFYMDIFTPKAKDPALPGHGLAIVDVASGAWHADRGKIEDHKKAQFYDIFTKHGYTVFAVRPGTRGMYTALEMVGHVKTAIRYIKAHAADYGIDPKRLGLTGPSAGGHLATLVALTPEPGDPSASDPLLQQSTDVQAAGIFFPPTDFLNWNGNTNVAARLGDLYFKGGVNGHTPEEIEARAKEISPRYQVKGKTPPFLIFHGDADPMVPLQQSEVLVAALKEQGNEVTFTVVPGGAHPWPTIDQEVAKMADWFDAKLRTKS